jgi:predicted RNA methylase
MFDTVVMNPPFGTKTHIGEHLCLRAFTYVCCAQASTWSSSSVHYKCQI